MEDLSRYDTLYQETLDAAQIESRELSAQIEQLRELLGRLESRKGAVEDICDAISRWVELDENPTDIDVPLPFAAQDTRTVSLTEEEVSLIAYPRKMAGNS